MKLPIEYLVPPKFFAQLVILKDRGIINDYGFKQVLEYKIKESLTYLTELLV